jgi:hypothetical protein
MTSHLGVMLLFALSVSIVFATLQRDESSAQWRLGARIFAGLSLGAFAAGWAMHLFFR